MRITGKRILGKIVLIAFVYVPLFLVLSVPFLLAGAAAGAYLVYGRNLPVIPEPSGYKPKTVSTFYAEDGTVIGIFYKEKRFVVELGQMPPHMVKAFIAAEDIRFYEHTGVDPKGILRAFLRSLQTGRLQGGSTITQQVTRNFLLTQERKLSRKIKEVILAPKLERAWGKERVLYVYLNEIYLGEGCHGVEAAARNYFDKPVEHLTVAESALIAGIVPNPSIYNPFKNEARAVKKQHLVLEAMVRGGFISQEDCDKAKKEPLRFRKEISRPFDVVPDFAEYVRQYIVKKYGGDNLLNEGLKVFTTCNIQQQHQAEEAVEKGLKDIKERQKNLAILRAIDPKEIPDFLEKRSDPDLAEGTLCTGVVLDAGSKTNAMLTVALSPKVIGRVRLENYTKAYRKGHIVGLRFLGSEEGIPYFALDNVSKLQSALVCIENKTGYVRALVGGGTREHFKFNRATQARRQPGSAFKPIIYSTAIEKMSYSPATIIVDEELQIKIRGPEGQAEWIPRNADGKFLGPISLRWALEQSRNICTIKILMDVRFDPVIEMARSMGIRAPLGRNLSLSLGTSELSLFELTSAYTVFPNSGIYVKPTLVKRIEDRYGNVIEDNTTDVEVDESTIPAPTPRPELKDQATLSENDEPDEGEVDDPDDQSSETDQPSGQTAQDGQTPDTGQEGEAIPVPRAPAIPGGTETARRWAAMSPQTAYIMTQLLQGGVRSGTGAALKKYVNRKDLAGKTGTTQHICDAWFMGFNPDYTTGVWVGFDDKRPIGIREEGSRAALPIWGYFMDNVLKNRPEKEFITPPDIVWEEMFTFQPNKDGMITPLQRREPVYGPFAGKTLVLWPDDPVEILRPAFQQQPGFGAPLAETGPAYAAPGAPPWPSGAPRGVPQPNNQQEGQYLPPGQPVPGYQYQPGYQQQPAPSYQQQPAPAYRQQPDPGYQQQPQPYRRGPWTGQPQVSPPAYEEQHADQGYVQPPPQANPGYRPYDPSYNRAQQPSGYR